MSGELEENLVCIVSSRLAQATEEDCKNKNHFLSVCSKFRDHL